MNPMLERSALLLGEEKINLLKGKEVVIFGVGGVGGTALECLARSGVGKFRIVDEDIVSESNLNRQILYTAKDIGAKKVESASSRIKSIGDIEVIPECYRVSESSLSERDYSSCSFIIDAVDDIKAKVAIIEMALKNDIPFAISLGMANRLDPSKVEARRLDKTENDPLARALRHELRKKGMDLKKVMTVFSTETPIVKGEIPASMMMVPSSAGLLLAYLCIKELTKD